MSIVQMKRLRVISLSSETDLLLRDLTSLGCIELNEPVGNPDFSGLALPCEPNTQDFSERKALVKAAIDALAPYGAKKPLFAQKPEVTESELLDADFSPQYGYAKQTADITARISAAEAEKKQIQLDITSLRPWEGLDLPLEYRGGTSFEAGLFTIPTTTEAETAIDAVSASDIAAEVRLASTDRELHYMVALAHRSASEQMWDTLRSYGALRVYPDFKGTASENIAALNARYAECETEIASLKQELTELAGNLPELERYYDRLSLDENREQLRANLIATQNITLMEGWIPAEEEPAAAAILERHGCAYEMTEPEYDEDDESTQPPVVFKNNKFVSRFTVITELYGMPKYSSIVDPNPFVAPFFLLFFGIMMADVGYGLLFAVASFIILKKAKPTGMMDNLLHLVMYGGISMIIWGVLLGSWFGDVVQQVSKAITGTAYAIPPVLFDPISNPTSMLVMSMAFGVLHIFTGMGLSAWRKIKKGHWFDAVCDEGFWYLVLTGLILALVGVSVGLYVALAGVVGILIFGGRHKPTLIGKITGGLSSLYDISGYFSDVLSYSRLLALGLTTAVVASVMNIMATIAGFSIPGIILFVVVFLVGHAFNLVINVLGAAVHALRLQYVEFFSRFYESGGRKFNPAYNKTKYVNIKQ